MRRIRTIKPELLGDERLGACSVEARWLFVAGLLLADDVGRFRAAPALLKAQAFPFDAHVTAEDVAGWLQELVAAGPVETYTINNQQYARYRKWAKHQRVDNRSLTLYPASPSEGTEVPPHRSERKGKETSLAASGGHSPPVAATGGHWRQDLDLDLELDLEGENTHTEANLQHVRASIDSQASDTPLQFTCFIQQWPVGRRVQLPAARRAWDRALRRAPAEVILQGARRWSAHWAGAGDAERYVPSPARWLDNDAWNDPTPTTRSNHSAQLQKALDTFLGKEHP